jgi:hypothetical protein
VRRKRGLPTLVRERKGGRRRRRRRRGFLGFVDGGLLQEIASRCNGFFLVCNSLRYVIYRIGTRSDRKESSRRRSRKAVGKYRRDAIIVSLEEEEEEEEECFDYLPGAAVV